MTALSYPPNQTDAAGPAPETAPQVSVVIPLHDEEPNVVPLVDGIRAALEGRWFYEVVLVDDGSHDNTRQVAQALARDDPRVRVLAHPQAGGQSAAVHSGVLAARAAIIATLDGDGQNPPADLPKVIAPLAAPESPAALALVAGQRVGRRDTLSKRLASRLANALRGAILKDRTRDTGCGMKAFRRDAYLSLPFFNHQHRFLPALFARDGWQIAHVDVSHAARMAGRSKYSNLHRALVGIVDLAGVYWLIRRRKTVRAVDLSRAPEPTSSGPSAG
ncbi:dolichol-phosphate mannosyltransferase [Rhodovulum bhavnagarense]|uniref:Dolichol-phosphate mannosyltransferase n=1 Tax=Rhodovulum bhavnagarense TaxID=992286 RepID=A0A4V2SWR7_9RHOB|nr:glycosyltransferase family 2 protein [Rhodovulum bhavnagarense]TCP63316.1 dolichol-phosphate mannosyltransferase [Rhodovulum bhavnagarense]